MGIILSITLKQIKYDKQRFLITVLGMVMSTAMIVSVLMGYSTFIEFFKNYTISQCGDLHIQVDTVQSSDAIKLCENPLFSKVAISEYSVRSQILTTSDVQKIDATNVTFGFFDMFNVKLVSGDFPKNPSEAVISQSVAGLGYKIGETITGTTIIGKKTITLKITGVLSSINKYSDSDLLLFYYAPPFESTNATFYAQFRNIDNGSLDAIYPLFDEIKQTNEEATLFVNTQLLETYGVQTNNNLFLIFRGLSFLMLIIIAIASAIMCFNSFAMATSQKRKMLGLLASIGTSPRQKSLFILTEAFIIGIIAIPFGLLIGYFAISLVFNGLTAYLNIFMNRGVAFKTLPVFSFNTLLATTALSSMILLFSAYFPAKSVAKISPIEAIRSTGKIKIKHTKSILWVKTLFGFEGELAAKNQKRNFNRYVITLFSLVVATVVLLVSVAPIKFIEKTIDMQSDLATYNMHVNLSAEGEEFDVAVNKIISTLPTVDKAYTRELLTALFVDSTSIKLSYDTILLLDKNNINSSDIMMTIEMIPDDEFVSLGGSITEDNYLNTLVCNSGTAVIDDKRIQVADITNLASDDNIDIFINKDLILKVSKVLDDVMLTSANNYFIDNGSTSVNFIIPQSSIHKIYSSDELSELSRSVNIYIASENSNVTGEILNGFSNSSANYILSIYDNTQEFERYRSLFMILRVVSYGFTLLITLISCANISNTVFSGVVLRRREYATIRSIGMCQNSVNKVIILESAIYAIKALGIGLPLGILLIWFEYKIFNRGIGFSFTLPYGEIILVTLTIFTATLIAALPALSAMKKSNIIDELKQESDI